VLANRQPAADPAIAQCRVSAPAVQKMLWLYDHFITVR
jgi:hypothetical protein